MAEPTEDDVLEIEVLGSGWKDIRNKALKSGEEFFLSHQDNLMVYPFTATLDNEVVNGEGKPIRREYVAIVTVRMKQQNASA